MPSAKNMESATTSLEQLRKRRVLVTGARGFLGSHLCTALVRCGADVTGVSRNPMETAGDGFSFIRADLSQQGTAARLLAETRPEIVFHLASHGVGGPDLQNVIPTFRNDLLTSVEILDAAARSDVGRVLMASSLEEPVPGTSETTPSSPYAAAKWAAGAYARMFHELYGTSVVLTRPYMTYGPRQGQHKLIPYVVLSLLRGQAPQLGSGSRTIDWVYVDDVIQGLLAAAVVHGVDGMTIDLGSGELVSIKDVVMRLVKIVGTSVAPAFGAIQDRPVEKVRVADMTAARKSLGWSPKVSLEDGLRRTVDWFQGSLAREVVQQASRL